jgi:hypothetical protein
MGFIFWLFSPETALWIVGVGIGAGLTVALAPQTHNVRLGHIFLGFAWVWAFGCVIEEIMFSKMSLWPSLGVAFLAGGSIGALGILAHFWVEKNRAYVAPATPVTAATSVPLPHLKLSLTLDSVTDKNVEWHLTPETDHPIENIQVRFDTGLGSEDQIQPPIARSLSPGDQSAIAGPTYLLAPRIRIHLRVTLTYNLVGNPKEQFASTFGFFFVTDRVKTVAPDSIKPTESVAAGEAAAQSASGAASALGQPIGAMSLVLPELLPDGTPNIVNGGNKTRAVTFNPIYRIASFRMKFPSGESVTLTGQLQKRPNGLHLLILAWDESKRMATLEVDGVKAKRGR